MHPYETRYETVSFTADYLTSTYIDCNSTRSTSDRPSRVPTNAVKEDNIWIDPEEK